MVMVAFGLTGMNPLPGSESGGYFGKLGLTAGDRGVHPHRPPDMAVGVAQVAAVHEAVILDRIDVGRTAMKGRGRNHRIDGVPVVERQGERDLARCRGREDRKSTRLNSSHLCASRMPSSA